MQYRYLLVAILAGMATIVSIGAVLAVQVQSRDDTLKRVVTHHAMKTSSNTTSTVLSRTSSGSPVALLRALLGRHRVWTTEYVGVMNRTLHGTFITSDHHRALPSDVRGSADHNETETSHNMTLVARKHKKSKHKDKKHKEKTPKKSEPKRPKKPKQPERPKIPWPNEVIHNDTTVRTEQSSSRRVLTDVPC